MGTENHTNTNTGTMVGSNLGNGNTHVIHDSFNREGRESEIAALLAQLRDSLAPARDELKVKDAKILDDHVANLTTEARKPSPDGKALALTAAGLVEAAKALGVIADPVIAVVDKIVHMFPVH